jgi:hypothetical protein
MGVLPWTTPCCLDKVPCAWRQPLSFYYDEASIKKPWNVSRDVVEQQQQ